MSFAATEREELAAALLAAGPDAPTCCEGWTSKDLAIHLLLRQSRPDAALGIVIPKLSSRLNKVTADLSNWDYETIVTKWRDGKLKKIDPLLNTAEHFIHHEDLRRAQPGWQPRALGASERKELGAVLQVIGKLILRKSTKPVVLIPQDAPRVVAANKLGVAQKGNDVVRVTGAVGELLCWVYGRPAVGIEISGPADAIVKQSL